MSHRLLERRQRDVLEAHRDLAARGHQLGDSAAHDAGAEHRDAIDRRCGSLLPVSTPRRFHEMEERQQVLADRRHRQLADGPGLGLQTGLVSPGDSSADDLERSQGGGIVTAGRPHRPLPGLVEENPPTDRIALQEQRLQVSATARGLRRRLSDQRPGLAPGPVVEAGGGQHGVDESQTERLARRHRLAGEDQIERCSDTDAPRQPGAAAPPGDDSQPDLRQADAQAVAVGGEDPARRQGELGTAAEADAGDGGHGGEGEPLPGVEQTLAPSRAASRLPRDR